jgi:hypothetical protein
MPPLSRRRFLRLAALAPLGGALGCNTFPTVFGYQMGAGALYDPNIRTVYVPEFYNRTFQTTPYRGFEYDITQAVVNEIGRTTNFRVTSDPARADTELIGVIMVMGKNIVNRTQQNTVREGELMVGVDVVWRDLRDGTILSAPRLGGRPAVPGLPGQPGLAEPPPVPFDPSVPVPPPVPVDPKVIPYRITAFGRYLPEVGESNASAMQRVQNQIAVQIVSMMEKPW